MLSRTRYLAALQQTSTSVCSYSEAGISSGIDVLTEAHLIAADLEVYCDVLTRVSGTRREDPVAYYLNPAHSPSRNVGQEAN